MIPINIPAALALEHLAFFLDVWMLGGGSARTSMEVETVTVKS